MKLTVFEKKQIQSNRARLQKLCEADVKPMLARALELRSQADALDAEAAKALALMKKGEGWRPKCTCDQQWTNPRCPARLHGFNCANW